MSADKNVDILEAIRDVMKSADQVKDHEVMVGYLSPIKAESNWKGYTFARKEPSEWADAKTECKMTVVTAIVFKTDASKPESQFIQAARAYNAIHAVLEDASDKKSTNAVNTALWALIRGMQPSVDEPGIVTTGFDDADTGVRIGETWEITYLRDRGATS